MNGDYTTDVSITGGNTWSESTISVDDGDTAKWVSDYPSKSILNERWMELSGTDEEDQRRI